MFTLERFLKILFERDAFFSMPRDAFQRASDPAVSAAAAENWGDCVGACMAAATAGVPQFRFDGTNVCFRVSNPRPEDRKIQRPQHLPYSTTCISVQLYDAKSLSADDPRLVASGDCLAGDLVMLDLRAIVGSMAELLSSIWRWDKSSAHARPLLRDVPARLRPLAHGCVDSLLPVDVSAVPPVEPPAHGCVDSLVSAASLAIAERSPDGLCRLCRWKTSARKRSTASRKSAWCTPGSMSLGSSKCLCTRMQ